MVSRCSSDSKCTQLSMLRDISFTREVLTLSSPPRRVSAILRVASPAMRRWHTPSQAQPHTVTSSHCHTYTGVTLTPSPARKLHEVSCPFLHIIIHHNQLILVPAFDMYQGYDGWVCVCVCVCVCMHVKLSNGLLEH